MSGLFLAAGALLLGSSLFCQHESAGVTITYAALGVACFLVAAVIEACENE